MTPLHLAAESGSIKKVNYLCDEGADINIQDNDGVSINAGRLADWVSFSLISRQVLSCCLPVYQHSSSKNPSNSLLYVAGSEESEYHIKITNINTIQSWCMHIMIVSYTTKSANLKLLLLKHFLFLSPISKLPCMLLPAMAGTTQWNVLLRKELTWTIKTRKG